MAFLTSIHCCPDAHWYVRKKKKRELMDCVCKICVQYINRNKDYYAHFKFKRVISDVQKRANLSRGNRDNRYFWLKRTHRNINHPAVQISSETFIAHKLSKIYSDRHVPPVLGELSCRVFTRGVLYLSFRALSIHPAWLVWLPPKADIISEIEYQPPHLAIEERCSGRAMPTSLQFRLRSTISE